MVLACDRFAKRPGLLRCASAQGRERDINGSLKQQEHQTERVLSLRAVLVAAQIAVSLVLLSAGFLFIHNLLRATAMNPGFDIRHTVWSTMRLVPGSYEGAARERQVLLTRMALEPLRALSGVETAAITRRVPLNDNCVMGMPLQTDLAAAPVQARYQCNNVGPDSGTPSALASPMKNRS